jgi:hypothetical protein
MNGWSGMFSITKCQVPANTMLNKHLMNGAYADCYATEIRHDVSFPEFILTFYTTPLFRLERLILRLTVSTPSTDIEARQLADGARQGFAAWTVEKRGANELLMCDFLGRTRSWFMVVPMNQERTQLYFGSAVSPKEDPKTGRRSLGFVFHALLGFHQIYSILLLYSAKLRIQNQRSREMTIIKKENS